MSIVELSLDTIDAVIAANSVVLVDFDSAHSASNAEFKPVYAASARRHPEVVHATVDVDAQEPLAEIAAVR
jgi:thioredoxin reductase (NADPH)